MLNFPRVTQLAVLLSQLTHKGISGGYFLANGSKNTKYELITLLLFLGFEWRWRSRLHSPFLRCNCTKQLHSSSIITQESHKNGLCSSSRTSSSPTNGKGRGNCAWRHTCNVFVCGISCLGWYFPQNLYCVVSCNICVCFK